MKNKKILDFDTKSKNLKETEVNKRFNNLRKLNWYQVYGLAGAVKFGESTTKS